MPIDRNNRKNSNSSYLPSLAIMPETINATINHMEDEKTASRIFPDSCFILVPSFFFRDLLTRIKTAMHTVANTKNHRISFPEIEWLYPRALDRLGRVGLL